MTGRGGLGNPRGVRGTGKHGSEGVNGGGQWSDGLNPTRQRGFSVQKRIETPTLNDMKAKQGAIVSKFMTFMNRKDTAMIELYERNFYIRRPGWDSLANFVYSDLCPTDVLRQSVQDVQFHPVKMILFIKFRNEGAKNIVVDRLQSPTGVFWTEYGVHVKGHSLDANVKLIRILGVSPETTSEEIKSTFLEVGIGEVVDLRKGLLDPKRMPGVTNGTWLVRVRITDPNKVIPPYIIRRDEGELWSLNFDGRRFVCWKCGSSDHIGDKCRDQERTFEEVFGDDKGPDAPISWAAVVRGSSDFNDSFRTKRDEIAKKIQLSNKEKGRKEGLLTDSTPVVASVSSSATNELETKSTENVDDILGISLDNISLQSETETPEHEKVEKFLKQSSTGVKGVNGNEASEGLIERITSDEEKRMEIDIEGGCDMSVPSTTRVEGSDQNQGKDSKVSIDSIDPILLGPLPVDKSFERIFGLGATKLALQFESEGRGSICNISEKASEGDEVDGGLIPLDSSTPDKAKKRFRGDEVVTPDKSDNGVTSENFGNIESFALDSKKQKMGNSSTENLALEKGGLLNNDAGGISSSVSAENLQLGVTVSSDLNTDSVLKQGQ